MEIWKGIKNYPNYEVSTLGNVRVLAHTQQTSIRSTRFTRQIKGRLLSLKSKRVGYPFVNLYNEDGHKGISVHRLVAEAFIPNPENKPQVNHINNKRDDPRADNLEWVTCKENIRQVVDQGRHSMHISKNIVAKMVEDYRNPGIKMSEIYAKYNLSASTVAHIIYRSTDFRRINTSKRQEGRAKKNHLL